MRVKVDAGLCIGSLQCQQICPDVFRVEGNVSVVQVDEVPPALYAKVRQAAARCPSGAIQVDE